MKCKGVVCDNKVRTFHWFSRCWENVDHATVKRRYDWLDFLKFANIQKFKRVVSVGVGCVVRLAEVTSKCEFVVVVVLAVGSWRARCGDGGVMVFVPIVMVKFQ